MSVESASLSTGVMRPPSGMLTASATLMLSLYVMPPASLVQAADAPHHHRHHTPPAQERADAPAARTSLNPVTHGLHFPQPRNPQTAVLRCMAAWPLLFQHHTILVVVLPSSRAAPAGGSSARLATLQGDGGMVKGDDCSLRPPAGHPPANRRGCFVRAMPAALASSAVIVTPLGFSFLHSASSLSVVIVYATLNSGTWSPHFDRSATCGTACYKTTRHSLG